jgi:hypothetical protein
MLRAIWAAVSAAVVPAAVAVAAFLFLAACNLSFLLSFAATGATAAAATTATVAVTSVCYARTKAYSNTACA